MTDTPDRPSSTATDGPTANRRLDRAREIAAARFPLVVAVLLVLAVFGVGVAYATHVSPGEQTERDVVATWTETGGFDHAATVQRDTAVFENGTELDDRSTYFTSVSPELDVEYAYRHRGAGPAAARTTLTLVVRSTGENEEFWRIEERLDETSSESLVAGERQTVGASVNVTRLRERVRAVESDLGAAPGDTSIRIVAKTRANASVNGEAVAGGREDALMITPNGGTYGVAVESGGPSGTDVSRRTTVPAAYGPARSLGGPLLALFGVVGACGLGWARRTGRLDVDAEVRRRRAVRRERAEFDEWITVGRLPDDATERRVVETDSLEGLVDVAIDSDRRVVEDRSTGVFAVLDGEVSYTYEPPGEALLPADESAAGSGRVIDSSAAGTTPVGDDPVDGDEAGDGDGASDEDETSERVDTADVDGFDSDADEADDDADATGADADATAGDADATDGDADGGASSDSPGVERPPSTDE